MHLRVEAIYAGYDRDVDVLRNITLEARPGQLIGIIGPNGAGKSTLLKTICQFIASRAGTIEAGGNSLRGLRPDQLAESGIGYLMEGHSVFPGMSVEDNLYLGAWSMRGSSQKARAEVEKVLQRVPMLREKRAINAGLLSGGQQRILEIERLYISRPRLVLLDEPSLGLSPKLSNEMLARAQRFRDDEAAVILVDQNARKIAEIADYLYVMQLGSIVREGPGKALLPEIDSIVSKFI